jgi:hypothetical protein
MQNIAKSTTKYLKKKMSVLLESKVPSKRIITLKISPRADGGPLSPSAYAWPFARPPIDMKTPGREREEERKNAIYSGHLRLCQQPRAAHALRSEQF